MFAKMAEAIESLKYGAATGYESNPEVLENPRDPEKLQTFIRQVETRSQRYPEYRDNKVDYARRFMAGSVLER